MIYQVFFFFGVLVFFPSMNQREKIIHDVNSELISCMIELTYVYDFMSYLMIQGPTTR